MTAFVATTAEQRKIARSQLAFYASTPSYRSVMDLHGWGAVAEQLSAHAVRAEWAAMPSLLSDEMLDAFCLTASEADLPAALEARYYGLADRLGLYNPYVPGQRDSFWRRLADSFASPGR